MRKLAKELGMPRFSYKNGKVVVTSKEDLEFSPNLADSLNLTFAADYRYNPSIKVDKKIDPYRREGRGIRSRHGESLRMWKVI
jgi:hypothetical protein